MTVSMTLYTACGDCGAVLIVDAQTRDSDVVRCLACGYQEEARVLRKPFRSQFDEGPMLPTRDVGRPQRGYFNA
jgi:DNA-directed RNA polymerase subunit RPC12/RpoP